MPDWLFALITLTAMEIVLGIDNIIVLTIMVGRLPVHRQRLARQLGLGAALGTRLLLLFTLAWLAGLTAPLFHWTTLGIPARWLRPDVAVANQEPGRLLQKDIHGSATVRTPEDADAIFEQRNDVSVRDLILILGGFFLIWKSVREIHEKLEEARGHQEHRYSPRSADFGTVIAQIAVLDIVFSLDSVITAVGMANQVWVMVVAMIAAMVVMFFAAGPIGAFVSRHPTMKMLALSFLILIGVMLVADGFGQHIDRGYIYSAMGFSVLVEFLNLRLRAAPQPAR
jgi:predicted tellurium resistance membrane protein TerC